MATIVARRCAPEGERVHNFPANIVFGIRKSGAARGRRPKSLSGDDAPAGAGSFSVGGEGFVTRFAVNAEYLARFPVQKVGGSAHTEYWVPAEQLGEFNANIVGLIEVIEEFRGPDRLPGDPRS